MKLRQKKSSNKIISSGYTLLEMTVAIVVGLMIAVMSLTLFNHQLVTYKILGSQNFLVYEAPQVHGVMSRIIGKANFFQLYESKDHAETSSNPVIEDGKVLAVKFVGTDEVSHSYGVIEFDSTTKKMNYYHVSSLAELSVATPRWVISNQVEDLTFYVEEGVLRTQLVGPNGGEIIYSTTTQR